MSAGAKWGREKQRQDRGQDSGGSLSLQAWLVPPLGWQRAAGLPGLGELSAQAVPTTCVLCKVVWGQQGGHRCEYGVGAGC